MEKGREGGGGERKGLLTISVAHNNTKPSSSGSSPFSIPSPVEKKSSLYPFTPSETESSAALISREYLAATDSKNLSSRRMLDSVSSRRSASLFIDLLISKDPIEEVFFHVLGKGRKAELRIWDEYERKRRREGMRKKRKKRGRNRSLIEVGDIAAGNLTPANNKLANLT